ncbi:helix-turn-helix domain-containing protein [Draconibacterium orientale]|uniref:HTH cro/C1-type domain-containing protein n=1 Tax=Draconibacterium orientale TaxID=1168034 RepID=A0ABM5QC26_9BACT|nr:helix-turn-helix domain-containing protein [Draconibacterium orientale]AHW61440.1 hypothetical protein FH5T_01240 [Draconibacterium orientale]
MKQQRKSEVSTENQTRLKEIASFLKEYRLLSQLTQEEICKISGLSKSSVIRLEAAEPTSFLTICKYLTAVQLPLNQLFLEIY